MASDREVDRESSEAVVPHTVHSGKSVADEIGHLAAGFCTQRKRIEEDVLPAFESQCPVNPHNVSEDSTSQESTIAVDGHDAKDKSQVISSKSQKGSLVLPVHLSQSQSNWYIVSTLGEGGYGEVKLVEDAHQQRLMAVKIISLAKVEKESDRNGIISNTKREICLHSYLHHENIIRFVAKRTFGLDTYIFLEYACGGELYDRIDPDIGVKRYMCHKWFSQLISGLEYIHARGVVHRDIKPENLLLDELDNLKISDFGLATIFLIGGKKRLVQTKCGTPSYAAPEVLNPKKKEFDGPPLDVWSAGVVLVTMLSGELPWEEASLKYEAFQSWKAGSLAASPWNKIPAECIGLLRKMLEPNADKRASISQIHGTYWFKRGFTERAIYAPPPKRIQLESSRILSLPQRAFGTALVVNHDNGVADGITSSQPVRLGDLLMSQSQGLESLMEQNPLARLVKRMTRFYITCSVKEAVDTLRAIVQQMHMSVSHTSPGSYMISGEDQRKAALTFKVCFVQISDKLLMDFRLSKGDGLEFKRIFGLLKEKLDNLVDEAPVLWTTEHSEANLVEPETADLSRGFEY